MKKAGATHESRIDRACSHKRVANTAGGGRRRSVAWVLTGGIVLAVALFSFFVTHGSKVNRTPADFLDDLRASEPWLNTLANRTRIYRLLPKPWVSRLLAQEFATSRKREDAARELGRMGTNAWVVIPELVSTLRTRNVGAAYMSAQALFRMSASEHPEWKSLSKPLKGSKEAALIFNYLLVGNYQLPGFDWQIVEYRRFALVGLAATGPAATPFYGDVMQNAQLSNEPRIRAAAVTALTGIESQRTNTVPFFGKLLSDPDEYPEVSASAAAALVEVGSKDPQTRELLRKALRDKRSAVRVAAVGALWRLNEPVGNLLPVLTQLLEHKLASVRIKTLKVVAEMGADAGGIRPQVEKAMEDPDSGVRAAAQRALKQLRNN